MPSDRKVPNEVVLNIAIECLSTVPIMGGEGHGGDEYHMQNFSWIVADPAFAVQLLIFTWKCSNEAEARDRVMILLANRFNRASMDSTISGAKANLIKLVEGAWKQIPGHIDGP